MEVINPILCGKKKWSVQEFTSSGTWTVPKDMLALFMVFGGGGNPSSAYNAGAGSGHLNMAWVPLHKGETVTATIAIPSTNLGSNGQSSSLKVNFLNITALGGEGVNTHQGKSGGSGGGAGMDASHNGYLGGDASYGGGGGGSGNYAKSPGRGGQGGIYGGGGGAGGASYSNGTANSGTANPSNRGQSTTQSPSKNILIFEKAVGQNTMLGSGGASHSNGNPISATYKIEDEPLLLELMRPIIEKHFKQPNFDLSFLESRGGKTSTTVTSGGGGGAGAFSRGQSAGASSYTPSGSNYGYGGGGGGGLIGSPYIIPSHNLQGGGGGGAGFLSNPSTSPSLLYGGRGTGVFDYGWSSLSIKAYASGGQKKYDGTYMYGLGGIAFILY